MRLLIDANIYRHPAAGAYLHINDELIMWGPRLIATRHYEFRFRPPAKRRIAKEVYYIPALAKLGRAHGIEFFTYWLIDYEMEHMPAAFDWVGRSIFDLFNPDTLPWREPAYSGFTFRFGVDFDLMTALRDFILGIEDVRLRQILSAFGPERSQDAFHVWTCEREGIDCIVTLDGDFQAKLRGVRKQLALNVNAAPPSEICRRFGISPEDQSLFEASDTFRNTRLVKLFDRRASLMDKLVFRIYTLCIRLSRRLGQPIDFVIPGYGDDIPRAPAQFRH